MRRLIRRCVVIAIAGTTTGAVLLALLAYLMADRGVPGGTTGTLLLFGTVLNVGLGQAIHDWLHTCSVCGVQHDHSSL